MGFFDVDYSNASAEQVTPGHYEVYVSDYQISSAKTGNTVVNLFYTVRDDVNQPHQGAKIQYDKFVETINSKWRWDTAAKAAGIPDGTQIPSANDWANLMVNRDIKIKVDMSRPNDQGNTYPEVKSFYPTEWPNQGRPMPQLEKAYENQQFKSNLNQAANRVAQHGYNQGGFVQNNPNPAGNSYQNQGNYGQQQPQQQQQFQQQTLGGIDPVGDRRSFANGGLNSINISDDDLPF